jgi:hypothetical protein
MATGTGKTRTCIGLTYRLLKTGRFRRVLFLVDRSALGEQTANAYKQARLESLQTFADRLTQAFETLSVSICQKAIRGDLVPQDPHDEPASALLQRIRIDRDRSYENTSGASPGVRVKKAAGGDGREMHGSSRSSEPAEGLSKRLPEIEPEILLAEAASALWPLGPLAKDHAVRRVADHLRQAGYVQFERLRSDELLFEEVLFLIEAAVRSGRLDRPRGGYVRACKPNAADYTAADWRHALVASLGTDPTDRDEALRAAAEWARENLGLAFECLRGDGQIADGLRSAINSAIRRGEVIRHDARYISRAPRGAQAMPPRVTQGRA